MTRPRVRPTFDQPITGEPDAFFAALHDALSQTAGRCRGQVFGTDAILRISHDERRIWSPALHLHLERDLQGGTTVRGQFAPSSPVWTAFVGIYIALLCVLAAALCYGWAQVTLDRTPWAFIGVPVALGLAGFTYGAAFIGQGLGAEDMHTMRSFVERVARGTGLAPRSPARTAT